MIMSCEALISPLLQVPLVLSRMINNAPNFLVPQRHCLDLRFQQTRRKIHQQSSLKKLKKGLPRQVHHPRTSHHHHRPLTVRRKPPQRVMEMVGIPKLVLKRKRTIKAACNHRTKVFR